MGTSVLGLMEVLVLGALGVVAIFLVTRLFYKGKGIRWILAGSASILLGALALILLACSCPQTFHFVLPYDSIGTWKTTDLDGGECEVDVLDKPTSNSIPPGVLDRLKLVVRTHRGGDSITYQTHWRHGLSTIRPADGGIDTMTGLTCCQSGYRFLLQGGQWLGPPEVVKDVGTVELMEPMKANLEEEIRDLVDLIQNSPRAAGGRFNPVLLVRAVNGLHAAGKDRALRAIDVYRTLAVKRGDTGRLFHDHALNDCEHHKLDEGRLLPILALLFNHGSGEPQNLIRTTADVPFRVALRPGEVEPVLKDCLDRCRFRDLPIRPARSPLEAAVEFLASDKGSGSDVIETRKQALFAVHNVYGFTFSRYGEGSDHAVWPSEEEWSRDVEKVKTLHPIWDSARQDFVRGRK